MSKWTHRIDALPEVGKAVEIMVSDGNIFVAVVQEREPQRYEGVGAEVQYQIVNDEGRRHGDIVPGHTITKWRSL